MKLKKFSAWSVIEFSWLAFAWLFFGAGYFMLAGAACSQTSVAPAPVPTVETDAAAAPLVTQPHGLDGRRMPRPVVIAPTPLVDTRTEAQKANAACLGSDGKWYCGNRAQPHLMAAGGTGTPGNCGPVCSVSGWFLDPQNTTGCASDANSGTSATCGGAGVGPVLTMAQIVQRYGTPSPKINFGVTLTVTWLSPQTINVDDFRFDPLTTGFANFVMLGGATGTGTKVGSTFLVSTGGGSITAKVQTTAGAPLKLVFVGSVPAGIAVGQLIQNVTLGSWATVYKIAGLTVSVTQPLASAGLTTVAPFPVFTEDNAWAAGNTYQLWSTIGINVKNIQPQNGDGNVAFTQGTAWYQGIRVFDSSATPGDSGIVINPIGGPCNFSLDVFDAFITATGVNNGGGVNIASCQANGTTAIDTSWFAGAMNIANSDFSLIENNALVDADCIIDGTIQTNAGRNIVSSALFTGTVNVNGGSAMYNLASGAGATQLVYGAGTLNVNGGGDYHLGGSIFANALKMATLQLDGLTTFDTYLPSAGTWVNHAGPFTAANIDTGGGAGGPGVQNARTGSRYSQLN